MRAIIYTLMFAVLAVNVAGCGHKGRLKSPTQMEADERKKAQKAAKEEEKKNEEKKDEKNVAP